MFLSFNHLWHSSNTDISRSSASACRQRPRNAKIAGAQMAVQKFIFGGINTRRAQLSDQICDLLLAIRSIHVTGDQSIEPGIAQFEQRVGYGPEQVFGVIVRQESLFERRLRSRQLRYREREGGNRSDRHVLDIGELQAKAIAVELQPGFERGVKSRVAAPVRVRAHIFEHRRRACTAVP